MTKDTKAAKVGNAEYSDVGINDQVAGTVEDAGPEARKYVDKAERDAAKLARKAAHAFELGKPAHKTVYLDRLTGEVTESQPERGQILVQEGDLVTQAALQKLG